MDSTSNQDNTLWVFGCSFTENSNNSIHQVPWWEDYLKFKGKEYIKVWSEILSESLKTNLHNFGYGGAGNDYIFHQFIKNSSNIKENDTVIIEWSYLSRFSFPLGVNNSFNVSDLDNLNEFHVIDNDHLKLRPKFLSDTVKYLLSVRNSNTFIDQLKKRIEFIIHYCEENNIKLVFWTIEDLIEEHLAPLFPNYFLNFNDSFRLDDFFEDSELNPSSLVKDISDDTDGLIKDYHFCEDGHIFISNVLNEFLHKETEHEFVHIKQRDINNQMRLI